MIPYYIELLEIVDKIITEGEYKPYVIDILIDFKPKIYHYSILRIMNRIIENSDDFTNFILLKKELVTELVKIFKK
jgi:hypothetical protein